MIAHTKSEVVSFNKIVTLTDVQYAQLVRDGQIVIGDKVILYDNSYVYLTPDPIATDEQSGWMSAEDKSKLDAIEPSEVPVNDVKVNNVSVVTGGIANVTVPTDTSDLTNDAGFITSSALSGYATETWVGQQGYLTSVSWNDVSGKPSFATVATSGDYDDLTNKPTIPAAQVNSDWNAVSGVAQILNKPTLATVATTGAYSDLSGTPDLSVYALSSSLATVATSGDYTDLSNTPTIPDAVSGTNDGTNWTSLTVGNDTYNIPAPTAPDGNQKVKAGAVTFPQDDTVNFVGGNNITVTGNGVDSSITITEAAPIFVPTTFNVGTETITLSQADLGDIYTKKYDLIILDDQSLGVDINYMFKKTVESSAANVIKYDCTSIGAGDTVLHIGLTITESSGTYTPTAECVTLANAVIPVTDVQTSDGTSIVSSTIATLPALYAHNIEIIGSRGSRTNVFCTLITNFATSFDLSSFIAYINNMSGAGTNPGISATGTVTYNRAGGVEYCRTAARVAPGVAANSTITLVYHNAGDAAVTSLVVGQGTGDLDLTSLTDAVIKIM